MNAAITFIGALFHIVYIIVDEQDCIIRHILSFKHMPCYKHSFHIVDRFLTRTAVQQLFVQTPSVRFFSDQNECSDGLHRCIVSRCIDHRR